MAIKNCPYCDQKGKADSLVFANIHVETHCAYCIDGHVPTRDERPGLVTRFFSFLGVKARE